MLAEFYQLDYRPNALVLLLLGLDVLLQVLVVDERHALREDVADHRVVVVRVGDRLFCHHRDGEFDPRVGNFLESILLAAFTELGDGVLQNRTSGFPLRSETRCVEGDELERLNTTTEADLVEHCVQLLGDVFAIIFFAL